MIAGARFDEVFVSSHYRKLTAESARAKPGVLKDVLDFEEDFRANAAKDCYPLLARYDRLVEVEVQRPAYDGMDLCWTRDTSPAWRQAAPYASTFDAR